MGLIVRITEAEAVRDLPALLERVRTQGISVEILRGAEVVARLAPPPPAEPEAASGALAPSFNDLVEAIRSGPRLDPDDSLAFERDLAEIRKEMPMQNRKWD